MENQTEKKMDNEMEPAGMGGWGGGGGGDRDSRNLIQVSILGKLNSLFYIPIMLV